MPIPGKPTPRIVLENAAHHKTPVLDSDNFIPLPGYITWEIADKAIQIVYQAFEPQVKGVSQAIAGINLSFEYFHNENMSINCLADGHHIKLDPFWVANRALRTIYVGADQGMCITGDVIHELGHIKHSILPTGQIWTEEEKNNEPTGRYEKAFSLAEEGRIENLMCAKHNYGKIYISASLYSWAENRIHTHGNYSLSDIYPFIYGRLGDKNLLNDFRNIYVACGGNPAEMEKILSEYHKIKNFNALPTGNNKQRKKAKKLLLDLADWMDVYSFKPDEKFSETHQSLEMDEGDIEYGDSGGRYSNNNSTLASPKTIEKEITNILENKNYTSMPSQKTSYRSSEEINTDEVIFKPQGDMSKNPGTSVRTILEQIRNYYMQDINISAKLSKSRTTKTPIQTVSKILASEHQNENYKTVANLRGQEEFIARMDKVMEEAEYKISNFLSDRLIVDERKKDGRFSISSVMPSVMTTGGLDGKWYEQRQYAGRGHGDIEIVVGLDVSGSMSQHFGPMAALTRMLKKCFDSLDFSTSILIWSTEAHQVYGKMDRVLADSEVPDISDHVGGGTDPNCCGEMARRIFDQSVRARRFYAIMTDGGWARTDSHIDYMREYEDFWSLLIYYDHGSGGGHRGYNQYVELENMQQLGQAIVDFVEEGVSQTSASYM